MEQCILFVHVYHSVAMPALLYLTPYLAGYVGLLNITIALKRFYIVWITLSHITWQCYFDIPLSTSKPHDLAHRIA